MDTCTYGTQRKGDRAIGPYNYIRCGETSEKVGCSIGLAWVGAEAAFDESGHGEVWGVQGEWMGIRSVLLWGLGFPVMSRRIARIIGSYSGERWFVTVVEAWWSGFAVQGGQIQPPMSPREYMDLRAGPGSLEQVGWTHFLQPDQ